MNSKDLLSINEAFAKATSKVTTDEPAKKDEVVTEGTENVNEFAGRVVRGVGQVAALPGDVVKKATKWAGDKLDQRRDDRKAGRELRKHREKGKKRGTEATEDVVDDFQPHPDHAAGPEVQPGDQVKVELPGAPAEVGEVLEIMPDASLKVATSAKPDGVVVSVKYVTPLGDDEPGSEDEPWDDDPFPGEGVKNIMDEYEDRLTSSKYKVREKAETGKDFKKPDEKVSEVDSKSQRPKGEVKADEKSKDVGGAKEDLQEPVEIGKALSRGDRRVEEKDAEKKPKKEKKVVKESINNCNKGNIMSEDKSIFDKLYESVMGEDDEFELGIPGDDDPAAGDEFGDEGGEEVTVTLTPDQAAALKAVVDQLPSDDEEELGDVGDDDPLADTGEIEDSVQEDTTQTGDGKKPGTDPSDGGGKTTDPAADSLGGKSTGDGAVPVTDKEGTEQTGDGKKPGVAKNSGKPGKLAV